MYKYCYRPWGIYVLVLIAAKKKLTVRPCTSKIVDSAANNYAASHTCTTTTGNWGWELQCIMSSLSMAAGDCAWQGHGHRAWRNTVETCGRRWHPWEDYMCIQLMAHLAGGGTGGGVLWCQADGGVEWGWGSLVDNFECVICLLVQCWCLVFPFLWVEASWSPGLS